MTDYSMVILKRARQTLNLEEPFATLEELIDQLFINAGDRAQTEEIPHSRFCESVWIHLGEEDSTESVRLPTRMPGQPTAICPKTNLIKRQPTTGKKAYAHTDSRPGPVLATVSSTDFNRIATDAASVAMAGQ